MTTTNNNNNNNKRREQERESLKIEEAEEDKIVERNRRAEVGDEYYNHFFKKCSHCGKTFATYELYYLNTAETVIVCNECFTEIKTEESIREMQKLYK